MTSGTFHYAVELYNEAGTSLGPAPVEVDFEPARESARLDAIRQGRLSAGDLAPAEVHPLWEPERGQPYLSGFEVRVDLGGGGEVRSEFGSAYFAQLAQSESARRVEEGRLVAGERFRYPVTAFLSCP